MSNDRFLKARTAKTTTDFVQDVNNDVQPKTAQIIKTKSQKQLTIATNTLPNKDRSRTKHGRSLSVPLFVEELELIEKTVEKISEQHDISVSNFIRQIILDKCLSTLGKTEYDSINNNKRNVIK